jgi:hypothetical protein
MTTYITRQGTKLTASSSVDLVEKLQRVESASTGELQDFMNQIARRCQTEEGVKIRTTPTDTFVGDLIQNDYLRVIDAIDG